MFSAERRSLASRFVRRASEGYRGEKLISGVREDCRDAAIRDLAAAAFLAVTRQCVDQASLVAIMT